MQAKENLIPFSSSIMLADIEDDFCDDRGGK